MADSTRDEIKNELCRELARVNEAIVLLKKQPRAQELEGAGDNTPLSEDMDAVSSGEEEELRAERLSRLLDRAAALDEAAHRVDRGTYGVCTSCSEPIAAERLRVVPEAPRCAACQAEIERAEPRDEPLPGEWEAVEETYRKREEFDDKGFDPHPKRIPDS